MRSNQTMMNEAYIRNLKTKTSARLAEKSEKLNAQLESAGLR